MNRPGVAGSADRGLLTCLGWAVALLSMIFAFNGCGGGPSLPDDGIGLVPNDWVQITVIDVRKVLEGDPPPVFVDEFEDEWNDRAGEIGVLLEDITTSVAAFMPGGSGLRIITGDFNFETVRDELFDAGMDEGDYRGYELWGGGSLLWTDSIALLEDGGSIVMEIGNPGALSEMLRGLSRQSGLIEYDDDTHVDELMERSGEGWSIAVSSGEDCWGVRIRGCEAVAGSVRSVDEYEVAVTWAYLFSDERSASAAQDDLIDLLDRVDQIDTFDVEVDGPYVVAVARIDEDDWTADSWLWPSRVQASTPGPATEPRPAPAQPPIAPTTRPATTPAAGPAPAPVSIQPPVASPAPVLATAPAPTQPPAAPPAPTRAVAPPPAPTQSPIAPPAPTPTLAAPVATPAPTPVATPAATMDDSMMPKPSGSVTIAVLDVNSPNGLPRFCTAGCSETIYMSGLTETLFNSKANPDGTVTTEPMLALDFTLDPSLEFGTFALRQGVQFHHGWGEMTARDVAYSYNDANSVTNPASIHGQAGDFAPLIASIEAVDDYTVQLNYRNYDSRGVLHRFSRFWQTAAILSKDVFDQYGVEGTQDVYVGVGAFMAEDANYLDAWKQNEGIRLVANPDYYATGDGNGPFVESLNWLEVPEGASRRAMLEAEEAHIAQIATKDFPELQSKGFELQKKGLFNTIRDISWVGNYWESHSGLTGEALDRERDISKPWIGDPFENGDFDENTPSMQNSMKVRNAFSWAIEREELVENLLGGLGFVNHQAYLSSNNPSYREEWSWGTDFEMAKSLMAEAGQSGGFEMDLWVGTSELGAEIGESVGAGWEQNLGVKVNLIKTAYSTYRPGLVSRTNKTVGVNICGDENKSNFPYDWAHGFVVSSFSAGGYGVGQEIPYATEIYSTMAGEPDKAKREELAARFYSENRKWANCTGLFEEPIWPVYNPAAIAEWDMRPMANGNLGTVNNVRTIKLK